MTGNRDEIDHEKLAAADRRQFLQKCGRYAAATPPAVALMLSAAGTGRAVAATSGEEPPPVFE